VLQQEKELLRAAATGKGPISVLQQEKELLTRCNRKRSYYAPLQQEEEPLTRRNRKKSYWRAATGKGITYKRVMFSNGKRNDLQRGNVQQQKAGFTIVVFSLRHARTGKGTNYNVETFSNRKRTTVSGFPSLLPRCNRKRNHLQLQW
jgi:hypothetical protein